MELITRRAIPWAELEALQEQLVEKVRQNPQCQFLLLSEPTPTFTHGTSSSIQDLLWTDAAQREIAVHRVDRGGKWTYHGPGQILVYPIVSLASLGFGQRAVRRFVAQFANCIQTYLKSKGVQADIQEDPYGLFVKGAKIASFGLNFRKGISSHGAALYLTPQSPCFAGIVPCGVTNAKFTSLLEAGSDTAWESVASELGDHVKRGFQAPKNW